MELEHEVIDESPPCGRLGICLPTDLTGNGRPDLIVGGMGAEEIPVLGTRVRRGLPVLNRLLHRLETNIFWYENPGWERHAISTTPNLYVFGNALGDVDGDGRVDLLVGQGIGKQDIYWFRQPADPRDTWEKHLVASDFDKYHDLAFGDVDNDGDPEVVGVSQQSETVFYYDVPEDPTQEPWPEECLHVIAEDTCVEGLEIVDIDDDGKRELIAGTSIYRQQATDADDAASERVAVDGGGGEETADGWTREDVVTGWDWTRVAVADLDDDGDLEIVFSEGDSPLLGDHPGRVGWFDPPDWEPHILRDDMYCPHTVQVADFDGDGRPDIYVAEMGLGVNEDDAEHVVFRNLGDGEFEEQTVARGVPTHEAKAVDLDGDGRVDIVGKSYEPHVHVDAWYNRA
jgi:hypothetical protein